MAQLDHPNVVRVHDAGVADGEVFVAMEYVPGQTLGAWMKAAPRPWREVVRRFLQAGRGLAAAHAAGLVHRDFKPDNVLVRESDGRVAVSDFGLAAPVRDVEDGSAVTHPDPPRTPAELRCPARPGLGRRLDDRDDAARRRDAGRRGKLVARFAARRGEPHHHWRRHRHARVHGARAGRRQRHRRARRHLLVLRRAPRGRLRLSPVHDQAPARRRRLCPRPRHRAARRPHRPRRPAARPRAWPRLRSRRSLADDGAAPRSARALARAPRPDRHRRQRARRDRRRGPRRLRARRRPRGGSLPRADRAARGRLGSRAQGGGPGAPARRRSHPGPGPLRRRRALLRRVRRRLERDARRGVHRHAGARCAVGLAARCADALPRSAVR